MRIDLGSYIPKHIKSLSGRDKGEDLRAKLNVDQIDLASENVEIIIPKKVFSFNSSYFLGFLGPSVRKLGEAGFRKKYLFSCESAIRKNIEDGISDALKESNVLRYK